METFVKINAHIEHKIKVCLNFSDITEPNFTLAFKNLFETALPTIV